MKQSLSHTKIKFLLLYINSIYFLYHSSQVYACAVLVNENVSAYMMRTILIGEVANETPLPNELCARAPQGQSAGKFS